jgi:hypothetical protein
MAMIAVFVLLMILGGYSLTLVRSLSANRRMLQTEEQRLQAEWLAEAGLERAAAKLRATGETAPETWNIAGDELGGRGAGRVEIAWDPPLPESKRRHVRIEAEYPVDDLSQALVHREFDLNLDGTNPGETQ